MSGWDEKKHPRNPAGGHGGGEFTSSPASGKPGKPRRAVDPKPFMASVEDIGKLRSDLEPGMTVEQRRLAKPHDSVTDQLDKAIAKRGWDPSPVVMWGDVLGDGHHTYAAAKARGIKKIPAIQIYAEGPGIHPPGVPARRSSMALGHEKVGHTGQGLWHHKGMQLPAYYQHVANDLIQAGHPESEAVHMAVGIVEKWAKGGGNVTPETQAKAAAAVAEWERLRAKAKVSRSMSSDYDADGLDSSWEPPVTGLPDLTGLGAEHFDAAAGDAGPAVRAAAKLGSGARFSALKSELASKGASDPGALAAWIGRRKLGKGKFTALAATARKSAPAAASRAVSPAELFRMYPLEDCQIITRAQGDGSGTLVEAYATVFDQPAEIRDHQGHYTEIIDRTAFDDVLGKIRRSRGGLAAHVKVLYNHGKTAAGTDAPEFQVPLGVPEDIRPERRGLLTRTRYDAGDPFTERILSKIRAGSINAQSFVGGIIRSDPPLLGPGDRYRKRGGALQTVRRMTLGLREYGPVLWPAYSGAEILGVRMQLPGDPEDLEVRSEDDPVTPDDVENDQSPDEELLAVAGAAPAEADTSRYHQHALYRIRSAEIRERIGLDWD